MIRILFVNAIHDFDEVETRYNPLWPAYLSTYVESKLGKNLFDFKLFKKNFKKSLKCFSPDIVAISCVSQNYNLAKNYARIAKQFNICVIIGGIHITSIPESLSHDMDIGCIGEGEETFFELMKNFIKNKKIDYESLNKINGLIYWKKGSLIKTKDRTPLKSLNEIPNPDRSIIGYNYRDYIYTARGCAFNCSFCICTKFWGSIRFVEPAKVVEQIEDLVKNGVKVIRFCNENFTDDINYVKKVADLIISKGFHKKVRFSCFCRANTVNENIIKILKSMNIVSVKMGLESGSQRVLNFLKGDVTIEQNIQAVYMCKTAGFQVNGDFIIGSPDESMSEIKETYNLIKMLPLDFIDVNLCTPYPSTQLWEYAEKKGLVSENMDWEKINIKFHETKHNSIILSEKIEFKELYNMYMKIRRLTIFKGIKALYHTPWKNEIPLIFIKTIYEKTINFFMKLFFNFKEIT